MGLEDPKFSIPRVTRFYIPLLLQGFSQSLSYPLVAGIGVTANESRLDAKKVIEQINLARRFGFAGVALFDLDVTLEKLVFPYLKLGIW